MLRARPGTAACVLGTHDRDDAATSRHGTFTYVPRSPAASPLFEIVRSHLLEFLADSRRRSDDAGVPAFVERELRDFLTCGSFARGFARFRCDGCQAEILVPFTCKGRGFCPSCCGRRMAERSMHLVDSVLGGLPIRQWVLTCPWRLRYAMAWDHRLCRAVLAVFVRAVLGLRRDGVSQAAIEQPPRHHGGERQQSHGSESHEPDPGRVVGRKEKRERQEQPAEPAATLKPEEGGSPCWIEPA
ncbi:MAG: transposase zinc-binding domain-containing protein [Alphaproteobacteria bacterium]